MKPHASVSRDRHLHAEREAARGSGALERHEHSTVRRELHRRSRGQTGEVGASRASDQLLRPIVGEQALRGGLLRAVVAASNRQEKGGGAHNPASEQALA